MTETAKITEALSPGAKLAVLVPGAGLLAWHGRGIHVFSSRGIETGYFRVSGETEARETMEKWVWEAGHGSL